MMTQRRNLKKPKTVCPRCKGFMEKKGVVREGINQRFWGDSNSNLRLGNIKIEQYVCIVCGKSEAYQLDTRLSFALESWGV